MTVNVTVGLEGDKFVIVAEQNDKKLFKSPMKTKPKTRGAIEKQLRKDLKCYDTPLYGGMNIFFTRQVLQYLGE